jgi:hypothetical protein
MSKYQISKTISNECENPFCEGLVEIPNPLSLCIACFQKFAEDRKGYDKVYDYSQSPARLLVHPKEAVKHFIMQQYHAQVKQATEWYLEQTGLKKKNEQTKEPKNDVQTVG